MQEINLKQRKMSWKTHEEDLVEKKAIPRSNKEEFVGTGSLFHNTHDTHQKLKGIEQAVSIFSTSSQNLPLGTKSWPICQPPPPTQPPTLTGEFSQQHNGDTLTNRQYHLIGQSLIFHHDHHTYSLQLPFTLLQQKLYLKNSKKIFALRLTRNGNITELYTKNQETFVAFYVELSRLCVLGNFEEHYRLRGFLGKGHFSVVYEGENVWTKKVVAMKCYNKVLMMEKPGGVELVRNQIRNLHYLRRWKMSPLIETYETIDAVVLVQHKAQAGDMVKYLSKQQSNFNQQLIKRIIKQIIDKVALLHELGFVHRDLKPQNILFLNYQPNSPLYLSDLGLTVRKQQLASKKIMHYSCGTLGFVAPQVLRYDQSLPCYTQKCDVFSIGCIFYFLLTGTPIFQGRNQKELHLRNRDCKELEGRLRDLEKMGELQPQGMELMRRLLEVEPGKRVTAEEARKSGYFGGLRDQREQERKEVIFGETSVDMRNFIQAKVDKYWEHFSSKLN